MRGVSDCSGQWSVVSEHQGLETGAALAGRVLEGGVAGGVERQWLVVSGQWLVNTRGWRPVRRWRDGFWRGGRWGGALGGVTRECRTAAQGYILGQICPVRLPIMKLKRDAGNIRYPSSLASIWHLCFLITSKGGKVSAMRTLFDGGKASISKAVVVPDSQRGFAHLFSCRKTPTSSMPHIEIIDRIAADQNQGEQKNLTYTFH